jgi:hypothetical protein
MSAWGLQVNKREAIMGQQILNIPATVEGTAFLTCFKKFLNSEVYGYHRRGCGPRNGTYQEKTSLPTGKATWWALYLHNKDGSGINDDEFRRAYKEISRLHESIFERSIDIQSLTQRVLELEATLREANQQVLGLEELQQKIVEHCDEKVKQKVRRNDYLTLRIVQLSSQRKGLGIELRKEVAHRNKLVFRFRVFTSLIFFLGILIGYLI